MPGRVGRGQAAGDEARARSRDHLGSFGASVRKGIIQLSPLTGQLSSNNCHVG